MPRTPRVELAGGIHHITEHGNRKELIFHDERDCTRFLRELAAVAKHYRWIPLSYCLMSNHLHVLVETPEPTLGKGMRRLASEYARWFNKRHATGGGHLYNCRFWSRPVLSDEHFAQLLRYVALNPVTAGLCAEATQWRWSSHRKLLSGAGAHERVEALLDPWGGEPGARYRRLFDKNHELEVRFGAESPWEYRPPLEEILRSAALDQAMRDAHDVGYRLSEIATAVGLSVSRVSRRISRVRK